MPKPRRKPPVDESPPPTGSDSDVEDARDYRRGGYHPVEAGEAFHRGRYIAASKLGWGHFSTVWLAWDRQEGRSVALKIQKSAAKYAETARDEVKLLRQVGEALGREPNGAPPGEAPGIVVLLDHFMHRGRHGAHHVMSFEVLGPSLLHLLRATDYEGLPIDQTKRLATCLLSALAFIHAEGIIHTDVKPENVLAVLTPSAASEFEQAARRADDEAARAAGEGAKAGAVPAAAEGGDGSAAAAPAAAAPATAEAAPVAGMSKSARKRAKQKQKARQAVAAGEQGDAEEIPEGETADEGGVPAEAPPDDAGDGSTSTAAAAKKKTEKPEVEEAVNAAVNEAAGRIADLSLGGPAAPSSAPSADAAVAAKGAAPAPAAATAAATAGPPGFKLADLGNGCWIDRQFTDDVQTRQYRCPEVILGQGYACASDVWSAACVVFEAATGDVLFNPKAGKSWSRDEDHLALMMELLGPFPKRLATSGKRAKEFFNKGAELRHIKRLKAWGLAQVLVDKYELPPAEAEGLAAFLTPLLDYDPAKRATAAQALQHPWLRGGEGEAHAGLGRE